MCGLTLRTAVLVVAVAAASVVAVAVAVAMAVAVAVAVEGRYWRCCWERLSTELRVQMRSPTHLRHVVGRLKTRTSFLILRC